MGFSRQENWTEPLCPPPGDLSDPGVEPVSLVPPALVGRFLTTGAAWEAHLSYSVSERQRGSTRRRNIIQRWIKGLVSFGERLRVINWSREIASYLPEAGFVFLLIGC